VLAVLARRAAWNRNELLAGLGLIVGMLGLGFSYGHFRLQELATNSVQQISTTPVRMALIQGNIAQDLKWDSVRQEEWLRRYLDLSLQLDQPADLVIWPETAVAFFLQASPKELERIVDLSRRLGAPILTGTPMADQDESKEWQFYNSMVMIGALEKGNFRQRYDKHHLVPFGEYIPFRILAPQTLHKLTHGTKDFSSGKGPLSLPWDFGAIGPLICYEVIFPDEVRQLALHGAQWLINLTNDGWFGDTAKPQHLAMARMRAVENRLPMIRVANSGISAVFNHLGHELARIPANEKGAIVVSVSRGTGQSVWVRTGEYWIWLWLSLCVFSWLLTFRQGRRDQNV
ncbi:MAG: apolipoprotein N-acyltransferase, partial [Magnetococcales bacterium]|nr:apolipoprotein N-acyltransferase [Magnetococcales bacterium]